MDYPMNIQWHITTACQNNCRHCYLFDPATYPHERNHPLDLAGKLAVLDAIDDFGTKWGFSFRQVTLMGGDPLLAPDVFPFIEELTRRGKRVSLGGNPETLSDENLARLRDMGIKSYQLSLDGLEATHDATRSPGSFRRTVEGYERLERYGITAATMATLTPLNIEEFFELIDFVFYKTRSKGFAFDFVSQVGNGRELNACFTPEQVLALSERYLDLKKRYATLRPDFSFIEKPGAMRLLHLARGEAVVLPDNGETTPAAGCLIGRNCVGILSDGAVLSCRRFPEVLGYLPKDSLEDILLGNETLKKYRRPQFWKGCGNCVGWNWCRGCPAVCYGECGDPFAKPSTCYAHLLNIPTECPHDPIPMDTTYAEEAALIKRALSYQYYDALQNRTLPPAIPQLVAQLTMDKAKAYAFAADPQGWLAQNAAELTQQERSLLCYRYNMTHMGARHEIHPY